MQIIFQIYENKLPPIMHKIMWNDSQTYTV